MSALSPWISVRAAARRAGISPFKMAELVRQELVETLRLPRARPLVNVNDLDRLFKQSHRPAQRAQKSAAMMAS